MLHYTYSSLIEEDNDTNCRLLVWSMLCFGIVWSYTEIFLDGITCLNICWKRNGSRKRNPVAGFMSMCYWTAKTTFESTWNNLFGERSIRSLHLSELHVSWIVINGIKRTNLQLSLGWKIRLAMIMIIKFRHDNKFIWERRSEIPLFTTLYHFHQFYLL